MIVNLVLGQILSLLITASGALNQFLSERWDVNFCGTQTLLLYLSLTLVYLPRWILALRRQGHQTFGQVVRQRGPTYAVYSLLDCLAALLTTKAYVHTSIAVVSLVSTVSTPAVIILSAMFLGTTYRRSQYFGAALCISGIAVLSFSLGFDLASDQKDAKNGLGAILALCSALFYAVANVLAEKMVSSPSGSPTTTESGEFLAMVGASGSVWAAAAMAWHWTEPALLLSQSWHVWALVLVNVLCILAFYALLPTFLRLASATLFNLSLFTTTIYSAIVNYFIFKQSLLWSYPASFVIIAVGLAVYSFRNRSPMK